MKKGLKPLLILLVLTTALGVSFRVFPSFAEFYTLNISPVFRIPLSLIASVFPFSIAESLVTIFIIFSVIALLSGAKLLVMKLFKKSCSSHFGVFFKTVLYSLLFVYVSYTLSFESSYSRIPIGDTLGLEPVEMTAENITSALETVSAELSDIAEEIDFVEGQASRLNGGFAKLADSVRESAVRASEKYPIYQKLPFRAKPIAFSTPLAYTGISGIYSFFTGESNINTEFSDYTLPFTVAHEYSHQLGIGSEKEAEFSALLICLESEDPYVRYSAYSQVAITLSNLLFELDEESFYRIFSSFPKMLITDIYLSAQSTQKYSETVADEIATAINDTYLSLSGDGGVVSYSLSSQLYVSYFLRRN